MYQIVKFAFPFADNFDKAKPRPALVISPSFGKHHQVILAYITKNLEEKLETDIFISSKRQYFPLTGLHTDSLIKLHRVITVTPSRIEDSIGELPKELIPELKKKVSQVFQLK